MPQAAHNLLQDRLSREIALFSGVADLVQFIDTRTGNLRLTHPRPMQVGNLDADIRDLFHELVTEKAHSAGEAPSPAVAEANRWSVKAPALRLPPARQRVVMLVDEASAE